MALAAAENRPTDPATSSATLFIVGDVMQRDSEGTELVGRLLENLLADNAGYSRALILGDLCNDDGAEECYARLDRTSWGRLRPLLYAVPGNHDYESARRSGGIPYFFNYVLNGGAPERGWYAFDWGSWRIVALNSEVMSKDEHDMISPVAREQLAWFDREMQQHSTSKCVLTAYHRPMYSSGRFGSPAWVGPLFRKSYRYGVDLSVAGHEHFFARMPPLTPMVGADNLAIVDRSYGIESLIAGTGGAVLFPHPKADPQISRADRVLKWAKYDELVFAGVWGVTRIDLSAGKFKWRFIPAVPEAGRVYPSGSGTCHDNPPGYVEAVVK
jgi:hypothetical protein